MSCVVVPGAMLGSVGVTTIDVNVAGGVDISFTLQAARRVMNKKISITKLDPFFMIFSSSVRRDLKGLFQESILVHLPITNVFAGSIGKVYHEFCCAVPQSCLKTLFWDDRSCSCIDDPRQAPGAFEQAVFGASVRALHG